MMHTIVIAGRPNVGKSTLFNRMIGHRRSIVHDQPGVTRDIVPAKLKINEQVYDLLDTGGFVPGNDNSEMDGKVRGQVEKAIEKSSLILLVFDGREGLTHADREIVQQLRIRNIPMIAIINKVDPGTKENMAHEFEALGLSPIMEVSAEHGLGMQDLKDEIMVKVPISHEVAAEPIATSIAFVGRPNVGKSSLVNAILNEPRQIVSEQPGTTRDSIDIIVQKPERSYLLLDTAGIRRKYKVSDEVEKYSANKALRALMRADVIVLVLDANDELTSQDERIAAQIIGKRKGLLVVLNKWDLIEDSEKTRREYREEVYVWGPFLKFAALRFCSAKTGKGVDQILVEAWRIQQRIRKIFSQQELDLVFERIISSDIVSGRLGARMKIFRLSQGQEEAVPTFFVWCNDPRMIKSDFERYWLNAVSEALQLEGVPLKVVFRKKAAARKRRREKKPQTKFPHR